ncbi:MAG: TIGR03960 family B12-binding radical SAM protein [Nitrospirota bacterium]|nr:TIGR03960 family B12-binding radical SAM protein [Nitrospirota bacterium]
MYEDFLPLVSKPARYIDQEVNVVRKDRDKVRTKVCLLFPDTYEVGMSHLGLRILYHILNSREDTVAERVFSPWTDYEKLLTASGRPLTSLETNLPVSSFDILGITLQYELSYTNIVAALKLSHIPVRAADRTNDHPIVIAGGPCAVNPEPLADFIDVFFIGEAEEAIHEMVDLRQRHQNRKQYLAELAARDGFYVPSLGRSTVRRRRLASIETAPYPDRPILPLMKPVHDRVTVEVARGCIRGCRFCQAGVIYRPYRERSSGRVKDLLQHSLACTGYEELSLASLSSGDHSEIESLVVDLMDRYRDSRVSVSLPSLRVGTLTPAMIKAIASTRKTGFTLAPEAGTERLRRVINKPVSDLDLLDAAETIFRNGWSVIKLYFMIGLPTETDEDLDGIIKLANELLALGKRSSRRHVQLNVSVSTFVPKPHTPFQWHGQIPITEVRRKQAYLQQGLRKRGISLKTHNPETSLLEGAFARGGRELGRVIEAAVDRGCRMDGWTECFSFPAWEETFKRCGIDLHQTAERKFSIEDPLPWDHVKPGVTREFLEKEYHKAVAAEATGNCREECTHCGLGCRDGGTVELGKPARTASSSAAQTAQSPRPSAAVNPEMLSKIRIKYAKTGKIRFLSHLDFMTLLHRAVMRANIPIAFSQGFNPHPKMAFGPPLSVGMESDAEFFDMETDPLVDLLTVTKELNHALPEGLRILEARIVPRKTPSLAGAITRYQYSVTIPGSRRSGVEERIHALLQRSSVEVSREGKSKDIRPGITAIAVAGADSLEVMLEDKDNVKPRIQDVVRVLLELSDEETTMTRIRRTAVFCKVDGEWKDPMNAV